MIELLNNILSLFETIGYWLDTELSGLISLIAFAPEAIEVIIYSINNLPNIFSLFAGLAISINVIYLFIGR